jgi:hypothetical protein
MELINYNPTFDSDYLASLTAKAKKSWKGTDANEWLLNFRGEYEA